MSTFYQLSVVTTTRTMDFNIGASADDAFDKAVSIIDSTPEFVSARLDSVDSLTGERITQYDTNQDRFTAYA